MRVLVSGLAAAAVLSLVVGACGEEPAPGQGSDETALAAPAAGDDDFATTAEDLFTVRVTCAAAGGTCRALTASGCRSGEHYAPSNVYCGAPGSLGTMCCIKRGYDNKCAIAGGTCKALTSRGCGSGYHSVSARTYPCGPTGLLGRMCCMHS